MLNRVRIRNFQSLHDVDVPLAPLTVIVGASNSGKSAFLRALRTLAFNAQSPAFVTTGKKAAIIEVSFDGETTQVSLERGKALATYRIVDHFADTEQTYGKAGTAVPEDVTKVLNLTELDGEWINFAFQFDRPFLLDSPGTRTAKVIGDLTNINMIYEATREVNRRRLEATTRLKVTKTTRDRLRESLGTFYDLPTEVARIKRARELVDEIAHDGSWAEALSRAIADMETYEAAEELKAPEVPELDELEALVVRRHDLRTTLLQIQELAREGEAVALTTSSCDEEIRTLEEAHHEALLDLGTCPLCGKTTEGL